MHDLGITVDQPEEFASRYEDAGAPRMPGL